MISQMSPGRLTAARPKTQGLVAAPFTPMHADGSLNLELILDYVTWLRGNGVAGAFVGGVRMPRVPSPHPRF